jgi:hypothetical protein
MKKNTYLLSALLLGLSTGFAQTTFEETNGNLMFEAEDMAISGSWKKQSSVTGFSGTGYINWTGADQFTNPGTGTITTKIKINTPGTYKFDWITKVGEGTKNTDFNDSWLKFSDADDFFAKDNVGNKPICYPHGSGKTPNPEGAGKDGWFKIYMNSLNWQKTAVTYDNDSHSIFVKFNKAGTYTMLISARSKSHLIDKIFLTKEGGAVVIDPNPTTCTDVTLGAIAKFTTISISGFSPAYKDNARNALAIDAALYKEKFAAASTSFTGTTGKYDITINTLTELDGESTYRVKVSGVEIGTFKNPTTTVDYKPASKTFTNVSVKKGDVIQVEFNSHTNGKVPEAGGTALSRGRWTSLAFKCSDTPTYTEENEEIALSVYPNPSENGVFYLNQDSDFLVLDLNGNEILRAQGKAIDLSANANGVYILQIGSSKTKLLR